MNLIKGWLPSTEHDSIISDEAILSPEVWQGSARKTVLNLF
jgi:hypothetical protein